LREITLDRQFADLLVQLTDPFPPVGLDRVAAEDSRRLLQQLGLPPVTWVGCTSWCAAISATVFSPRIASSATRALNAAEWLRFGFPMDFVPPVTLSPGPKSTYTRVRKAGATSRVVSVP
jgi:hypothetical protein